jgi:hypothetical protein
VTEASLEKGVNKGLLDLLDYRVFKALMAQLALLEDRVILA